MSWVAVAVAAGAAISAGVGAYSSSKAGSEGAAAGSAAAKSSRATGKGAAKILDNAESDSMGLLEPYKAKLEDTSGIIKSTLAANIANLPNVGVLTKRINNLNQSELDRLLGVALPGVKDMVRQASNNTLSMLRGEVPADVAAQIRRRSASKALAGGFGGSESSEALTSRDLGLTSLNLMQEGSNSAQRWIQTARSQLMPALFDPTSQLSTPQMTLSSILASAGIAKDQAEIMTKTASQKAGILMTSGGAATQANLDGQAAKIAGDRQAAEAIGKGVQGVTGAAAGMYMPAGGAGGAGAAGSTGLFGVGGSSAAVPPAAYGGTYTGRIGGVQTYRSALAA